MKRQMAGLLVGLATMSCALAPARADEPPYQAGVVKIVVPDVEPFDTFIWYPTEAAVTPFQAGPMTVDATLGAPIAGDERFPVVLLSHGSGGSPFGHRELAASLARSGFVVVTPTQLGDSTGRTEGREAGRAMLDRPRQARAALDAALADARFAPHEDPARLGMVGFSAGGYTTLVLAGARPDFQHVIDYCTQHHDVGSCGNGDPRRQLPAEAAAWQPPPLPGLKAIVLMDPLAVPFDAEGYAPAHMPVLLFRPASDDFLSAMRNAAAVAAELPTPPAVVTVLGSHFVFLDPCPPAQAERIPAFCKDAPGVDRIATHRQIEGQVAAFLHNNL